MKFKKEMVKEVERNMAEFEEDLERLHKEFEYAKTAFEQLINEEITIDQYAEEIDGLFENYEHIEIF